MALKVPDFGLAKALASEGARATADRRAGIWAFGVVLFEMLAGTAGTS